MSTPLHPIHKLKPTPESVHISIVVGPREDGDYELIATMNNTSGCIPQDVFNEMVTNLTEAIKEHCFDAHAVELQEADDVVDIHAILDALDEDTSSS